MAANPELFSSGEEVALFSDAVASRFTPSVYLRGDGCMDFGFSRSVRVGRGMQGPKRGTVAPLLQNSWMSLSCRARG